MSLIQITKKAATREEARELLDTSMALSDPFGAPTFVLKLEDFSLDPVNREQDVRLVLEAYRAFTQEYPHMARHERYVPNHVLRDFGEIAGGDVIFSSTAINYPVEGDDPTEEAHLYTPETYTPPGVNIVLVPSVDLTMSQDRTSYDSAINHHDLPGTPEQWQAKSLWHEYAHGTGAGEPQAETMAAFVNRKFFANNPVLQANADHRAFRCIFGYANPVLRETYGWGMVEGNDYAARFAEDQIDPMTEADIRRISFQKFDSLADRVLAMGAVLEHLAKADFSNKNLPILAGWAQALANHPEIKDPQDLRILKRFQLACTRIHLGNVAYVEGNDLIDPALAAVAEEVPMTFTPEYIPEA